MNTEAGIAETVVDELLRDRLADQDSDSESVLRALWEELEELGFTRAAAPEALGGGGATFQDACALARAVGGHAVRLPIVESLVGAWLIGAAGVAVPNGFLIPAPVYPGEAVRVIVEEDCCALDGHLRDAPWLGSGTTVFVARDTEERPFLAMVPGDQLEVVARPSLTGEPRGAARLKGLRVPSGSCVPLPVWLDEKEALGRQSMAGSARAVGALRRVHDLTVAYANDRRQFGKPISRFQAVQGLLAQIASEVAVTTAFVQDAIGNAPDRSPLDELDVAVANVLCGEAGTAVCRHAHQVHGAIGISAEYPLHRFSAGLLAWRDELGTEALWASRISSLLGADDGQLWPAITEGTAAART